MPRTKGSKKATPAHSPSPPPLPVKARTRRQATVAATALASQDSTPDLADLKKQPAEAKPALEKARGKKNKQAGARFWDRVDFQATYPLPGALGLPLGDALWAITGCCALGFISHVLSYGIQSAITQYLISNPELMVSSGWDSIWGLAVSQTYGSAFISGEARGLRHLVAWDDIYSLTALNLLISAPMTHLLTAFYNVPLRTACFVAGINIVSDIVPVLAYKAWAGPPLRGSTKTKLFGQSGAFDPGVRVLLYACAIAFYNFTVVQSTRISWPTTMVLHFHKILTLEPAYPKTYTRDTVFGENGAFWSLFHSPGVLAVSIVSGVAVVVYTMERLDYKKNLRRLPLFGQIAIRSVAASLAVGAGVFAQCFTDISGVDAAGAAKFDAIWMFAPIIAGTLVGAIVSL